MGRREVAEAAAAEVAAPEAASAAKVAAPEASTAAANVTAATEVAAAKIVGSVPPSVVIVRNYLIGRSRHSPWTNCTSSWSGTVRN